MFVSYCSLYGGFHANKTGTPHAGTRPGMTPVYKLMPSVFLRATFSGIKIDGTICPLPKNEVVSELQGSVAVGETLPMPTAMQILIRPLRAGEG